MTKGGDKAVIWEGLHSHHAGFLSETFFPRAAEPAEHLEVAFSLGCLTCAAPEPGSANLVRGENRLCEPKLLGLSTAIPSRRIVAW